MFTLIVAFGTTTEGYAEFKTLDAALAEAKTYAEVMLTPTYTIVETPDEPETAKWRDAWQDYLDDAFQNI